MVFGVSKYLFPQRATGMPMLNEIYTNYHQSQMASLGFSNKLQAKQQFWRWFRSRPELCSPIVIRVNDTITEVDFYAPDGGPLGRNKRLEAERFWEDNFINDRQKSIWFDAMVNGSGYGWKGRLSLDQIKTVVEKMVDKFDAGRIDLKEIETKLLSKALDEDLRKTRVFDYIASSTMTVEYDNSEIIDYVQRSGGKEIVFQPQDVIHFPFIEIDGKVEGYTPVEGLISELILIWFIKENMLAYMRNAGLPKKIFSLPDEIANSPNHQFLIQQLQEYGAVENRHGHLVFTGKLDVQELEEKLRDLEYEKLHLLNTSNIAYAFQIPVTRIPYMIGQAQSKGDAGGLADAGYWSMIEADQIKIENRMNTQCLRQLGFIMKFKKPYKMNDIREAQVMMTKADTLAKMQSIFQTYGKELTEKKLTTFLDMDDDEIQDIPKERRDMMLGNMPGNRQGFMPNGQVSSEPDKQKKNETKRNAAENNPSQSNQTGY